LLSCVALKPTFSNRLRSWGTFMLTFVVPSWLTSIEWCSPFGPTGMGTSVANVGGLAL